MHCNYGAPMSTDPGTEVSRRAAPNRRTIIRTAILLFLLAGAGQLLLEAALPAYPEPVQGGLAGFLIDNNGAIVDFEVAGIDGAEAMVQAFGDRKWLMGASLVVDVAFLYAYAALLFFFIGGLADRLSRLGVAFAPLLKKVALLPLAASACDGIENLFLAWVVHAERSRAADIASVFAQIKFVLLGFALLCAAIGSVWLFVATKRKQPSAS